MKLRLLQRDERHGLCADCTALCCKTVMLPKCDNFSGDDLAWMDTRGPVVNGVWHINAPCRHLQADNHCGIYETRPKACRQYEVGGAACQATRKQSESG